MTWWVLLFRSLMFHARSHFGVLLGAIIGSGILVGALAVGDSVRGSLEHFASLRLGKVDVAVPGGDRFFESSLADRIDTTAAPVLFVNGSAVNADASSRANGVQILGVDERFWGFAPSNPGLSDEERSGVVLNQRLAQHLGASIGDSILLRVQKPSVLSREAPVSPQEDFSVAIRANVTRVITDEEFGRFSLQSNQVPPYSAFLSLSTLQRRVEKQGRANLLLLADGDETTSLSAADVLTSVKSVWTLADAELSLNANDELDLRELRSDRIFMDEAIVEAAKASAPDARGVLTYFVNDLRSGDRSTPYSMVAGMENWDSTRELRDDQIAVSEWLAEDLGVAAGDTVNLTYFVVGESQRLDTRSRSFEVFSVIPMSGEAADRTLMPDFPGVASAEDTSEWDAGFPIDLDLIREKDETYWDEHRGTPKAFVTLTAAQEMWANRFGSLTAVRFPNSDESTLAASIIGNLNPSDIGLGPLAIREQAMTASAESFDFGQLFIGFSFFLIAAALLLMALIFQFGVEQRRSEIGTLLALGFTGKQIRRQMLIEGSVIAVIGSVLGVVFGTFYARLMVDGLSTIWRDAVGTDALSYYVNESTLGIGAFSGAIIGAATIWITVRKLGSIPARELLASMGSAETESSNPRAGSRMKVQVAFGLIAVALATGFFGFSLTGPAAAGCFFGAGAMTLIAGLLLAREWLAKIGSGLNRALTLNELGKRSVTRRLRRSLTIVACLACGAFLVMAVEPFRLDANEDAANPMSGTGGFELVGQSAFAVVEDLNSADGLAFYGLDPSDLGETSIVPMRVKEGDDASCLNLNKAQRPQIFGVDPAKLSGRFSFAKIDGEVDSDLAGWDVLNARYSDGAVPAIGDMNTIQWAMKMKVGDTLDYVDDNGETFKLRIVGTLAPGMLQGTLLISNANFLERFPTVTGHRFFLINTDDPANTAEQLTYGLQDSGLEVVSATQRLAEFNAVQNTYLSTFQVLGGLGLVLGSVGLGIVVLRNVLERRTELAVLKAIGFGDASLKKIVLTEHLSLLLLGLGVGVISALIAVVPSLLKPASSVPVGSLALTLGAVFLSGLLWTWLATTYALRGKMLDALRND